MIILKYIFTLLLFSSFSFSYANQGDNKSLIKYKKEADNFLEKGNYLKALNNYLKVYKKDSLNQELNYKIGICKYNLKPQRLEAERFFQKADVQKYPEAAYYIAVLNHLNNKFDDAISKFNTYKALPDKEFENAYVDFLINKSKTAKEMIKAPLNVNIQNAGSKINSPFPDYVPLISADGSMMIFTSRRSTSTGRIKDMNGEYMEDIYVSYKKENEWTVPVSISKNINTDMHDACVALSPDAQQLIVYKPSEDLATGDLYLSKYNGKDWSKPEFMGSDINAEDAVEASATFSVDNSILIFSSDRPGGFGGKDLYRVVKLPNGEWSKAQNLGKTINTQYVEDAPFLHVDGKTLYFSSQAHKNMGGFDIFKTTMNDDKSFEEPENIGYPINTVNDDIYFVLSVSGDKGYFSSKGSVTFGSTDIYSIDIPDQNFGLATVNCQVTDNKGNPVHAEISLIDMNETLTGRYVSNKESGKFILIIFPTVKYKIIVQQEGYVTYTKEFTFMPEDFKEKTANLSVSLNKINQ